jgi:hypothetical protein
MWGEMVDYDFRFVLFGKETCFLDANNDEIAELNRTILAELALRAAFSSMPNKRRKRIWKIIAYFESYLNRIDTRPASQAAATIH